MNILCLIWLGIISLCEMTPVYFLSDSLLTPFESHPRHQGPLYGPRFAPPLPPLPNPHPIRPPPMPPIPQVNYSPKPRYVTKAPIPQPETVKQFYGSFDHQFHQNQLPVYREERVSPNRYTNTVERKYPIQAAVITRHHVRYINVPSVNNIKPTTIEVGGQSAPINILLRSTSSKLNIEQLHDGSKGSYQESKSEDHPHILKHTVTKPIIQEIFELITPYRLVRQEVQPVQELIETIVGKNVDSKPEKFEPKDAPSNVEYDNVDPVDHDPLYTKSSEINRVEQEVLDRVEQDYMAASANSLFSTIYGVPALASSASFG